MKKLIPILAVFFVLLAVPLAGIDAQEPIRVEVPGAGPTMVPCNGPDCSTCDLVTLGNTLITWLITTLFVVFAVIMVVAGFGLVTSGGSQSALEAAKSKFQNALIGIILVLAAWLIVDTLLKGILAGGTGNVMSYGPWNEVQCTTQAQPDEYDGGGLINEGGMPTTPTTPTTPATTTPTTPTGQLVPYAGYQFDQGILANVQYLDTNFDLRVSGGHRTEERNREVGGVPNSNHLTGRAADFVGSPAAMQAGAAWARANGAREAIVHNAGSGTHLHVAW